MTFCVTAFFLAPYLLPSMLLGPVPQPPSPTLISPTQTHYNSEKFFVANLPDPTKGIFKEHIAQ